MSESSSGHLDLNGDPVFDRRWTPRDLLCAILLLVAALLLRARWLDVASLNIDESQSAAHAAYLLGTEQTTFDAPYSPILASEVYRGFAAAFGNYRMFELRVLILVLSFVASMLIYDLVRRHLSMGYALFAGLLFQHLNQYYEGLSANREWFAGLGVLVALYWYILWRDRGPRKRFSSLLGGGLFVGIAILFKDQAVALAPIVACEAILDGRARSWGAKWQTLVCYGAGAAIPVTIYFGIFVARGATDMVLAMHFGFQRQYAASILSGLSWQEIVDLYWEQFYQGLPYRRIFLLAFLAPVVLFVQRLCGAPVPGAAKRVSAALELARPFAIYLVFALIAIQIGTRFFSHYVLFAMPAVAVLATVSLSLFASALRHDKRLAWLILLVPFVFLFDILGVRSHFPLQSLDLSLGGVLFVSGMFLLFTAMWSWRYGIATLGVLGAVSASVLFYCESAKLFLEPHLISELAARRGGYDPERQPSELGDHLKSVTDPDDLIYVWGYKPDVYMFSELEPATQFQIAYLLESLADFRGTLQATYDPDKAQVLIEELRARNPRVIVDACVKSLYGARYRLDGFQQLHDFVTRHYVLAETFQGYDLYVRRTNESDDRNPTSEGGLGAHYLEEADKLLADDPRNIIARSVKGDLLAQAGRYQEAIACYEAILTLVPGAPLMVERLELIKRLSARDD